MYQFDKNEISKVFSLHIKFVKFIKKYYGKCIFINKIINKIKLNIINQVQNHKNILKILYHSRDLQYNFVHTKFFIKKPFHKYFLYKNI